MSPGHSVAPANPHPCEQCPWRTANQGQRHPHGFYAKGNLTRLWAGLRRGNRMTCHPTDPRMAEFAGYEGTAEAHVTHECMGSLILGQRELWRFQALCEALEGTGERALRSYRQQYPHGLLPAGLRELVARMVYRPVARARPDMFGLALPAVNLNEPGVGYPPLGMWDYPRESAGAPAVEVRDAAPA